jgi:signal transduction histidine kinase
MTQKTLAPAGSGAGLRLIVAFSLLIGILVLGGGLALSRLSQVQTRVDDALDQHWAKVQLSRQALRYSSLNNRLTMQIFLLKDREKIDPLLAECHEINERISDLVRQLGRQTESDEEKKLLRTIQEARSSYVQSYQQALKLLIAETDTDQARRVMLDVTLPRLLIYHAAWEAFVDFQGAQMERAGARIKADLLAMRWRVLLLLGLGVLLAATIAWSVTLSVVRQQKAICQYAVALESSQARLQIQFDHMAQDVTERQRAAAELKQAQEELVQASRLAGMTEIATSVLHNVGNVLNSLNVSTSLISSRLKDSQAGKVARVAALLREHGSDLGEFITRDSHGKMVPEYLGKLGEFLASEQTALLHEMELVAQNVEHIKEVITTQQSLSRVSGAAETLDVPGLVEDALRLSSLALPRFGMQVIRQYDDGIPEITLQKHKVLQILVNLLRNAKYACDELGPHDQRVTVRVAKGEGHLQISVLDNGVGIPEENLKRIFNHGFTTRKDGHGFGLHSGVQAAKEMGGSLRAQSDGPGKGAIFTLELPFSSAPSSSLKA